jgi:hypothetical protein
MAAVELLEAYEYHSTTFAPMDWDWVFQTKVPWLAIAIVLTQLPHARRKPEINRARKQIDIAFERYGDLEMPLSSTPLWQLLVQLRQRGENQWDQRERGNISGESSLMRETGASEELPVALNQVLADDMMLDFGVIAPQHGPMMYDDALDMLDMDNMPWYAPLPNSPFSGFCYKRTELIFITGCLRKYRISIRRDHTQISVFSKKLYPIVSYIICSLRI